MDALLGSMTPVIPAVIGCAMMKVLLVLLPMLGVLTSESMTYQVLTVIGDGSFYFLPILVAASAARYFKANLFLSITIAGILIHPTLQTLFSSGDPVSLFGIPVTAANYPIPFSRLSLWLGYCLRWKRQLTALPLQSPKPSSIPC